MSLRTRTRRRTGADVLLLPDIALPLDMLLPLDMPPEVLPALPALLAPAALLSGDVDIPVPDVLPPVVPLMPVPLIPVPDVLGLVVAPLGAGLMLLPAADGSAGAVVVAPAAPAAPGAPVTELRSVLSVESGSRVVPGVVGEVVVDGDDEGDAPAGSGEVVGDVVVVAPGSAVVGAGCVVGAPAGVPAPAPEPLGEVVGEPPGDDGVVCADAAAAAPNVSAIAAPRVSERLRMVISPVGGATVKPATATVRIEREPWSCQHHVTEQ